MSKPTFDKLSRDVDWRKQTFLEQCQAGLPGTRVIAGRGRVTEVAVRHILDAYLALAEQFYEQYRRSLKRTYNDALKMPGNTVRPEAIPRLMQFALDKLVTEWNRVYSAIAVIRTSESQEAKRITASLAPVVRAATRDAGLSPEAFPLILQFGQTYNMGFFSYLDSLTSLSLPLSALKSPWEWTIVWHELAGERVRLLESAKREFDGLMKDAKHADSLELIEQDLRWFLDRHFNRLESNISTNRAEFEAQLRIALQGDRGRPRHRSLSEIRKFFRDPAQPLIMLSFDDLLTDIMRKLGPTARKAARVTGWSADWLQELFEDAFSVKNFPVEFLPIFDRLLQSQLDGGKGLPHPPHTIRMAVAVFTKMQTQNVTERRNGSPPEASSIDSFMTEAKLQRGEGNFDPDPFSDETSIRVMWTVAKNILELHRRLIPSNAPADPRLIETLSQAMQDYVKGNEPKRIYEETLKKLPKSRSISLPQVRRSNTHLLIRKLLSEANLQDTKLPLYVNMAKLEFGYTDFAGNEPIITQFWAKSGGGGKCPTCGGAGYFDRFKKVRCSRCGGTGRI